MKLINTILPLAALSAAFVIPDEQTAKQLVLESKKAPSILEKLKDDVNDVWSKAETTVKEAVIFSENAIDSAVDAATGAGKKAASSFECYESMLRFETQEWLDSATAVVDDFEIIDDFEISGGGDHDHPPHDGPPHDGPPHDGPPHDGPPHHGPPPHGPPHRGPHHDPHHKPNQTVYELIASSKYTTKLAELINRYPDLVKTLNGTKANYTVFAPTDKAFEKLPPHHKPSKELIEKVLTYHVSSDFYPAGRILASHTIPTTLKEEALGGPQRLRVSLGLKGLAVNFYSRVVAVNIFGTNGVIHGIDSLLLPPPPALKIVELLPGEFSTLQLALIKTGLFDAISKSNHTGGTLFAPSNFAFKKLGPRINAFLFSKYGEKYLKALLEYHVVANQTLYSDAFYKAKGETTDIPKGHFHIDLPTLLKDRSLSIDIARWGGFITIKINGFGSIAVQDGVAKDGVIHVVSSVLIPPKTPGGAAEEAEEDMDVEDFKERLLPSSLVSQEL